MKPIDGAIVPLTSQNSPCAVFTRFVSMATAAPTATSSFVWASASQLCTGATTANVVPGSAKAGAARSSASPASRRSATANAAARRESRVKDMAFMERNGGHSRAGGRHGEQAAANSGTVFLAFFSIRWRGFGGAIMTIDDRISRKHGALNVDAAARQESPARRVRDFPAWRKRRSSLACGWISIALFDWACLAVCPG
ncbi:hypothetical protein PT2222_80087 [Paraburkholderia tropica]